MLECAICKVEFRAQSEENVAFTLGSAIQRMQYRERIITRVCSSGECNRERIIKCGD